MGGQEALLLAARFPGLLAGVASFDAPVDLARRFRDFHLLRCGGSCPRRWRGRLGEEIERLAEVEVGGSPATNPGAYAEPSPLTYARRLAFSHLLIQLWWSRRDRVVVDGEHQSGLLFRRIRALNPRAAMEERVGDWPHAWAMDSHTDLPAALLAFGLLPLQPYQPTSFQAATHRRPLAHHDQSSVRVRVCTRDRGGESITALLADGDPRYPWPLQPFHRQHPVRGGFGDPRTVFRLNSPFGLHPAGRFSFHDGVDITGKTGEAVYPVVSGRVVEVDRDAVYVRSRNRVFSYWHLHPAVQPGEQVTASRSVLGRILPRWGHVHLGESLYGRQVNPALHLTPYTDTNPPLIAGLRFTGLSGRTLDPLRLHGRVEIVAGAYDLPSPPIPGAWRGMPVAPTLLRWQLTTPGGRAVIRERTAVDFRWTLPEGTRAFWQIYAPGSYQNFPTIGLHYNYQQPGNYLFRLTRAPLDTSRLAPGRYRLTVQAADICGNHTSLTSQITIDNHQPGKRARSGERIR